ncbi:DUF1571 domain-containing protein [Aquisphaera insulae]|uniref:DUF1571 domain-containing protein n=1 Tax=Aquisphaera insulae TaxID=2712864 RepID=UPI0013EC8EF0|nr:DUF1571 domain-containing protein [Aquisphaera insulae]
MDRVSRQHHRLRILPAATIVALAVVQAGCAAWDPTGWKRPSFSWNRPGPTFDTGMDTYAAAAAASRSNQAQTALAHREPQAADAKRPASKPASEPGQAATSPIDEPASPIEAPPLDGPVASARGSRPTRQRAVDSGVRVTLGPPESLPTLKETQPALASSRKTAWTRSEDRPSRPSRSPEPEPEPMPAMDPEPREEVPLEATAPREKPRRVASNPPARSAPEKDELREILHASKERLESMSSYQVNLTREERVGGQLQSEKDVVLSVRRKPAAVRLEWVGGPSKGREVLYSRALDERMMYVNLNNGLPLSRMSIPVDSPLALRNSRHPISEAGFDTILAKLFPYGDPSSSVPVRDGRLVLKGPETPDGYDAPCHVLERTTPTGEIWRVYLDRKTLMPAVVLAQKADSGELIEKYTYRNLRENPADLARAEAFDPDKRWGEAKGLFSRLAGGNANRPADKTGSTTTR